MFKLQRIELKTAALCRFFSSIRLILFFLFYFIIPARVNVMVRSCHYCFFLSFFDCIVRMNHHCSLLWPIQAFTNTFSHKHTLAYQHTVLFIWNWVKIHGLTHSQTFIFSFYDSWIFATCCGNAAFFPQNETKKYIYRKRYGRLFRYIFCYVNSIWCESLFSIRFQCPFIQSVPVFLFVFTVPYFCGRHSFWLM